MEVREDLDNYKRYVVRSKKIDEEIADLKYEDTIINGNNFEVNGDIKPQGFMSSNIEKKIISNVDKIKELEAEKEKIETHINYLDSLINTLDDDKRRVVELRYKYNKTDLQISKIINITKRAVNKRVNIALKILEKEYNNKVYLKST